MYTHTLHTHTWVVLPTSHQPLLLFNTLKNPMICWRASLNAYAHRFAYFLTMVVSWLHIENINATGLQHGNLFFSSARMKSESRYRAYIIYISYASGCINVHIYDCVCASECVYNNYSVIHSVSTSTNISRATIFLCICKHLPWISCICTSTYTLHRRTLKR